MLFAPGAGGRKPRLKAESNKWKRPRGLGVLMKRLRYLDFTRMPARIPDFTARS